MAGRTHSLYVQRQVDVHELIDDDQISLFIRLPCAMAQCEHLAQPLLHPALWTSVLGRTEDDCNIVSCEDNHIAAKPPWLTSTYMT